MGLVHAVQKGEVPASKVSKATKDAAEQMKKKDVEDFASTSEKGLPKKKQKEAIEVDVDKLLKHPKIKTLIQKLGIKKSQSKEGALKILNYFATNPQALATFKKVDFEESVDESGILYKAGVKKYGLEGMKKIQQAAGKRKSHAEIGKIKDKYEKDKKESVSVNESAVSFWQDMFRPGPIPKKYINQLIKKKGELPSKKHIKSIYRSNGNPSSSELAKSWKLLQKDKYVRAASGMWRWNADFTGWESVDEASSDLEKNFKWAKGKQLKAIEMMVDMDADGVNGVLKNMKKNPKAFKQFVKDLSKMRGMDESVNEAGGVVTARIQQKPRGYWAVFNKKGQSQFEGDKRFMINILKKASTLSPNAIGSLLDRARPGAKHLEFKAQFSRYYFNESVNEQKKRDANNLNMEFEKSYQRFTVAVNGLVKSMDNISGEKTDGKIIVKAFKKYLVPFHRLVNSWNKGYQKNPHINETQKRDYKAEYKKFQSSTKAKKYRAELNQYNRKKGTYGNGDGKDASHKGGKIAGFEKESTNRGRAEKSRLKKEDDMPDFEPMIDKILDEVIEEYQMNEDLTPLRKIYSDLDKKFPKYNHKKISDFNKAYKFLKRKLKPGSQLPDFVASFYNDYKGGEDITKNHKRFFKYTKKMLKKGESVNEAKEIKFHQIQPKDYIWYRGGIQYFVTKTGPNVLHMGLVNKGKPGSGGSLFASNTKLTRKNFDSQIRVKFIKKITRDKNTLWQESVNEANIIQKIDKLAKSNKYGTVDGTRMNGKTAKEIMAIFMHPKMNSYRRQMTGMKAHELVDLTISLLKPLKIKVESVDTVFKETLRKFIRQELVKEDWWSEMSPPAQDQYVKDHPDSEKAKSVKKSKEKGEKEKRELAKKIKSGEYELDSATGKAVKKKKGKEDPKKRNKHVAAIRKGYFPGTPEYEKFMKEAVNEKISKEEWAEYPKYARKLKPYMQKLLKVPLKVRVIKQANHNPWIEIRVAKFGKDIIPNSFRKLALKVVGGSGVRDMDNINYGNIRSNSISLKHDQWVKLLGNKV